MPQSYPLKSFKELAEERVIITDARSKSSARIASSAKMPEILDALVLRWNGQTLRVRCPYCARTHGHGHSFVTQGDLGPNNNVRRSDCYKEGGLYRLVMPYDNVKAASTYGWELDRTRLDLVTVEQRGVVLDLDFMEATGRKLLSRRYQEHHRLKFEEDCQKAKEDVERKLAAGVRRLDLQSSGIAIREQSQGEIVAELWASAEWRQCEYVSACILREIPRLETLFHCYPEDDLASYVGRYGENGIMSAAAEEDSVETMKWLQVKGVVVDMEDHYGRTPLMEAALWGRFETVKFLVSQGADVAHKDANGMSALDLAMELDRNAFERADRVGDGYRELLNGTTQRQLIRNYLKGRAEALRDRPSALAYANQSPAFFWREGNGDLTLYRPHTLLQVLVSEGEKAFASLDRGPNYPVMNAMSGYTQSGWPNVLDNKFWTDKAEQLRELLELPPKRSYASHVESQLLAYLMDRYTLADLDVDEDEFKRMHAAMPVLQPPPVITVSKKAPCSKCSEVIAKFEECFNVAITFQFVGDKLLEAANIID